MRGLALGVLAAAGVAFMAGRGRSGGQPPKPRNGRDHHARAAEHGHQPSDRGEPFRSAAQARPDQHADAYDERQKRGERVYWWITGTASVFATLATVAAAWFAFGAYTAALESVGEARKQVAAAHAANEISRRTLAEALGASIHVGGPNIETFDEADGTPKLKIGVTMTNSGGSTTRGLSYVAACRDTGAAVPDPFDEAALAIAPVRGPALGPKESFHPVLCDFGPAAARRVVAQRRHIYVFGRITHRDTVDPAATRRVEFCHEMNNLALRGGARALGFPCEKHNCADEECDGG